jgi:crotonobetainyl-CoA:carnitine CoA-transferase CaiB-like acyl-CoA transferase
MPGPLIGLSHTPIELRGPAPTRHPAITRLAAGWAPRDPAGGEPGRTAEPGGTAGPAEPPLAGLRVLNLGTIIAGPYSSTMLGELGAEVWKIERPPHGDEFRTSHGGRGGAGFTVYNRDQRSLLLNLGAEPGAGVFRDLARSADVVVDNYRVGVVDRLGIDYDHLAEVNPLITTVSISAFGEAGALRERPGFDPVVQAMSGIMRAQGGPDQANSPVFLTVPINDVLAAALAAFGACAALLARTRLDHGQHVEVTLSAASCLLQSGYLVDSGEAAPYPQGGRDYPGPGPLSRLYPAADGWVRLEGEPDQLAALAGAGLAPAPDEAADGDDALAAAIAARVGSLPAAEVVSRAHAAGVPAVRARQVQELTADDELIGAGLLTVIERDDRGVSWIAAGRWLQMPGLPVRVPQTAPGLGEHTDAVRQEAGLGG